VWNFFSALCSNFDTKHAQLKRLRSVRLHSRPSNGFAFWLGVATILRGSAMAQQGLNQEGIAQMEEGLAALRATGGETARPRWLSWLAEACMESGRLNDGLSALAEALANVQETQY